MNINSRVGKLENKTTWRTGLNAAQIAQAEREADREVDKLMRLVDAGACSIDDLLVMTPSELLELLALLDGEK